VHEARWFIGSGTQAQMMVNRQINGEAQWHFRFGTRRVVTREVNAYIDSHMTPSLQSK
jgi:hypothetical protein